MCALSVINADLWKVGQGTPNRDFIKFQMATQEEAAQARIDQKKLLTENTLI
jgi:allophanate hydrolase subunit 2